VGQSYSKRLAAAIQEINPEEPAKRADWVETVTDTEMWLGFLAKERSLPWAPLTRRPGGAA